MLKYSLVENLLTERPDDYAAQTQPTRSYNKSEVIDLILRRGTLLTRTDLVAAFNGLEETVVDIVKDGGTVNMPLFNTSFSISGVFDGPMDSFDTSRHRLNVNLTKGTLLRKAESEVQMTKTETTAPQPTIVEVRDAVSGTANEVLTPGGVIQLWGSNLKIAGENEANGLWFVPETGDAVKADVLVTNKPSQLIAMIPALPAANYTVRVVTQYNGSGKGLKTPKESFFDKPLAVK
ncbi:MAG: DNA-binding domain-containing protein [Bacteroidia bacterium]|nr:DNA-binding domain-containing protein [Bacteroidia bacterium]